MPTEQRGAATRLLFNANGYPNLVKCALAAGANVNARNKPGDTPEGIAAAHSHTEIVNLLPESQNMVSTSKKNRE